MSTVEQTKAAGPVEAPGAQLEKDDEAARARETGAAEPGAKAREEEEEAPALALPPLSAYQFRLYNRLAEHMHSLHEHFRQSWNMLYQAASSGRRPAGMSAGQYVDEGLQFISRLAAHHAMEESYVFPVLAQRMPEFRAGGSGVGGKGGRGKGPAAELLGQHEEMRVGMDAMGEYLRGFRAGEGEGEGGLDMAVLKRMMDGWGGVLWRHLDHEVEALGAENVRRYLTVQEIRRVKFFTDEEIRRVSK